MQTLTKHRVKDSSCQTFIVYRVFYYGLFFLYLCFKHFIQGLLQFLLLLCPTVQKTTSWTNWRFINWNVQTCCAQLLWTCTQTLAVDTSAVLIAVVRAILLCLTVIFKLPRTLQSPLHTRWSRNLLPRNPANIHRLPNQYEQVLPRKRTHRHITSIVQQVSSHPCLSEIWYETLRIWSPSLQCVQLCIQILQLKVFICTHRVSVILYGVTGSRVQVRAASADWVSFPIAIEVCSSTKLTWITIVDLEEFTAPVLSPSWGLSEGVIDSSVPAWRFKQCKSESTDVRAELVGGNHVLIAHDFSLPMRSN